jgi:anti-anti-sigma regulatory factor
MKKYVLTLPAFVSPAIIQKLFSSEELFLEQNRNVLIDFSKLKVLDTQSFHSILQRVKILELSGDKVAICDVSPHVAIEIATLLPKRLKILQSVDDAF